MASTYQAYCPTGCPTGCSYSLPILPSSNCTSPAVDVIDGLFIFDLSVPLVNAFYIAGVANALAITELTTRISNTNTTASAIRYVKIFEGSLASVSTEYVEANDGSKAIFREKQQIKWTDHDDSDAKYTFWSKMACITGQVGVIAVSGSKWYGDERLIKGNLSAVHKVGRSGSEPTRSWDISFDYIQTCVPPRITAII